MIEVLIVAYIPSPSLHGVFLPVSFEQSNATILKSSNDLTRLNVTYDSPLQNSAGPRNTTTWSTVHPFILWTVQFQHCIGGSCVLLDCSITSKC
ncbi:uncharacterized protein TNCT_150821 [Trichonephila clavata]|uniref:Uncharacterized protein n=1 Tax=Trichonephila clavata TaxID=2740835 RepID=A0A8X6GC85_TRICU|nr:uncharacterized protein TNCT_150821 [Trichonephila clavata]